MTMHGERQELLFVESNTSGTGRLFVRAASRLGFRPVLMTADRGRYSYLSEETELEVVSVPSTGMRALRTQMRERYGGGSRLAGIASSSEYFIATAARLAREFRLPGPDAEAVEACRDKARQRALLSGAGVPVPQFRIATTLEAALAAAGDVGWPVIVKPVDGSGSVGVRECTGEAEVAAHTAALFGAAASAIGDHRILVESVVEGPEFSVEIFGGRAVGVTRKHLGRPPYFVETGHDFPAVLSVQAAQMLRDTAESATQVMGLGWGPIHCELRLHGGRAVVIEINPRLAGGFIPELVRHALGMDLIEETLRLVTGQAPLLVPRRQRFASIRFLFAPGAGRLKSMHGLDALMHEPHVTDAATYHACGAPLVPHGDFRDRIGHIMTCADDGRVASSSAERARQTVRVEIDASNDSADVRRDGAPALCATSGGS